MMKKLIIPLLFLFTININAQNFQSEDTDTLYTIKDFGLRRYDRDRKELQNTSLDISSNKIKTKTRIYKSQLRDGRHVESSIISHYDKDGFKTNEEWFNRDSTFRKFKYDKWGNCIEELILNSRNEVKEKKVKEFDQFGNLLYHYSLKNGVEKNDMINEKLSNGNIIIRDISQTYHTSYRFDSNGELQEYTMSYTKNPTINGRKRISRHEGVKIDTLFESDSGNYLERQKFSYDGNKLIMIETFEEYERFYMQLTYNYNDNNTVLIDTVNWTDSGGLKNVRLFKYSNNNLHEIVDSTIQPKSEIYRTKYYYDNSGNLIQKRLYNKFSNKTRVYYDTLGRWKEERIYEECANPDTLLQTLNIKYDKSGNIIQKSYYFKNTLYWQRDYTFDIEGRLTYYRYGIAKPITEIYYTYDDLGVLSSKKTVTHTCIDCEYFDEEMAKSYPYVKIYVYDKYGNEIEYSNFKSNDILIDKTMSEYMDSLKISTSSFKNNEKIFQADFKYNDKDLLIYEQKQDFKRNSKSEISYEYEYYE